MTNEAADFEREVCEAIGRQFRLGVTPECVYRNRTYPAKDGGAPVEVDLAIEIKRGDGEPPLLWIWECKHHAHPLGVEEVQEFHAKMHQIGADKIRGTIVSRGPFSKPALDYARTHSIGAARYTPAAHADETQSDEHSDKRDLLGPDEWAYLYKTLALFFRRDFGSSPISPISAEDLAQETIIRLFKKLDQERLIVDLRAYALGIAQNVRREYHRRRVSEESKRQLQMSQLPDEPETGTSFAEPAAASDWEMIETRMELDRWLQELSEIEREVVMAFAAGETTMSLAEHLRVSPSTVRMYLHRTLHKLSALSRASKPARKEGSNDR